MANRKVKNWKDVKTTLDADMPSGHTIPDSTYQKYIKEDENYCPPYGKVRDLCDDICSKQYGTKAVTSKINDTITGGTDFGRLVTQLSLTERDTRPLYGQVLSVSIVGASSIKPDGSETYYVKVNATPNGQAQNQAEYGISWTFTPNSGDWNKDSGTTSGVGSGDTKLVKLTPNNKGYDKWTGTLKVTVTDKHTNQKYTDTMDITVDRNAVSEMSVSVSADSSILFPGQSAIVSARVTGGAKPYSYQWSGSSSESGTSSVRVSNASGTISEGTSTSRTYKVTITDYLNNTDSDSTTVKLVGKPSVTISSSAIGYGKTGTVTVNVGPSEYGGLDNVQWTITSGDGASSITQGANSQTATIKNGNDGKTDTTIIVKVTGTTKNGGQTISKSFDITMKGNDCSEPSFESSSSLSVSPSYVSYGEQATITLPKLTTAFYSDNGVNPTLSKSGPGTLDRMGTHGWSSTIFKADTADCHSFSSKSVTFSGGVSVNARGYCGDLTFSPATITINNLPTIGVVRLHNLSGYTMGDSVDLNDSIDSITLPNGVVETRRQWYNGSGNAISSNIVTSQSATSKTYELKVFMKAKDGSTATATDTTSVTWQDADLPTFTITGSGNNYSVSMTSGSSEWSIVSYSWGTGGNAKITSGSTSSSCTVTEKLSSFKGTSGSLSCDVKVKHKTSGVERTVTATKSISLSATQDVPTVGIKLTANPTTLPAGGGKVTLSVDSPYSGTFTYSGGSGTSNVRTVDANSSESSKTITFGVTQSVTHTSKYGDKVSKDYTASTTVSQAGKQVITYKYYIESVNVTLSGSGFSRTATVNAFGWFKKFINGVEQDDNISRVSFNITDQSTIDWSCSNGGTISGSGKRVTVKGSSYDTDYTVTATVHWYDQSKSGSDSFREKAPYEKLVLSGVKFSCPDSKNDPRRVPFGSVLYITPILSGGSGDYDLTYNPNNSVVISKNVSDPSFRGQAPGDDGTPGHSTTITFTVKDNVTGETVTGSQYVNFGTYVLSYFGQPRVETEGTAISTSSFVSGKTWNISSTIDGDRIDKMHDSGRSTISIGIVSKFGDEKVDLSCKDGGMNLSVDRYGAVVSVTSNQVSYRNNTRSYIGSITNGGSSLGVILDVSVTGKSGGNGGGEFQ